MKKFLLPIAISFISFPVFAFNYSFLDDAPASYLTKEDYQMEVHAELEALNRHKDGSKVSWSNPESGSFGYVIPSGTTHAKGAYCRNLTIFTSASERTNKATYKVCKINKEWKVPAGH